MSNGDLDEARRIVRIIESYRNSYSSYPINELLEIGNLWVRIAEADGQVVLRQTGQENTP